ncbi:MAG: M23 family metallopeptidase [Armatimonadetes bacterium]|nr:M23 family metallopeptidase [Armatimonadota bacterium]
MIGANRRRFILLLAQTALVALPPAVGAEGLPWSLDVAPQTLMQGQTIRVRIRTGSAPTATIRLLVGSAALRLHPVAGGYQAFVGTSPLTAPGLVTIRVEAQGADGVQRRTRQVRIRAGRFGTRRLSVPPTLLDPKLAAIERRKVAQATAAPIPTPQWRGPFRLPVDGSLTSNYGVRSVYNGIPQGYHLGVDFRAATGTPVRAAQSGVVTLAERLPLSGNIVMVDHGAGIFTTYQHLSAISVRRGARVARGQIVGRVGSTGLSTGPHLHWGMRVNGVRVNPLDWTKDGPLTAP